MTQPRGTGFWLLRSRRGRPAAHAHHCRWALPVHLSDTGAPSTALEQSGRTEKVGAARCSLMIDEAPATPGTWPGCWATVLPGDPGPPSRCLHGAHLPLRGSQAVVSRVAQGLPRSRPHGCCGDFWSGWAAACRVLDARSHFIVTAALRGRAVPPSDGEERGLRQRGLPKKRSWKARQGSTAWRAWGGRTAADNLGTSPTCFSH